LNQGVSDLTNVLSKNLDVSLAKANQYKIDYSRDLFTEETPIEIDKLLSNILEKYCQKIITKITKFAQEHSITNIYICGGGANTKNITSVLSNLLEQKLSGKIKINILTPDKINNVIDHTSTLRDTDFVPALALAKIGLQFSDFDSAINNFFKKIIQTLRN
jgi:Ethanolamine utilization protein EutJ (predicted chaperonin)